MITTVVFDLDDTLYDEADYCRSGFGAVAKFLANAMDLPERLSEQKISEAFGQQFAAGNYGNIFNAALDELGIDYNQDVILNMVHIYRAHRPNITLPAESREVLEQLDNEFKLAILTDGFLPAQQLKIEVLEITHYFDHIIYTEDLGRSYWKPHLRGFEMLTKKLGVKPAQCVYVGDNPEKDFIAPNKLGFKTIQIVRPRGVHCKKQPPEDGRPGQIIGSISQLPAAVKRLTTF